jgi:hypothetical protein
MKNGKKL